jgi:DNA-binding transcriptional ArsR family regulator
MANDLFGVLADPTRRHVLELLSEKPHRAGNLARAAGTSRPVMSRHLRILLESGFVVDERVPEDARARVFRLRPEPMRDVQAWLEQLQAHWREQLASFKHHVEKREDS